MLHHWGMTAVDDRRAAEPPHGRAFAVTPLRLARAVAQHDKLPVLTRMGGWRGLERALCVDLRRGLEAANADDLARRRAWFAPQETELVAQKQKTKDAPLRMDGALARRSRWRVALAVLFKDAPTVALWAAAVGVFVEMAINGTTSAMLDQSTKLDGVTEGVCLLLLAALMVSVQVSTAWQTQTQMKELLVEGGVECGLSDDQQDQETEATLELLRDGEPTTIPREEVCVGDLLVLRNGDVVEVDSIVVPSPVPAMYGGVRVDETGMTGVSGSVVKTDGDVVLARTRVVDGDALVLVLSVREWTLERQLRRIADSRKVVEDENCRDLYDNLYRPSMSSHLPAITERYVEVPPTPQRQNNHQEKQKAVCSDDAVYVSRLRKGAQTVFHSQVLRIQRILKIVGYIAAVLLLVVLVVIHVNHDDGSPQERAPTLVEQLRRIQEQEKRKHQQWMAIPAMALSVVIVTSTEGSAVVFALTISMALRSLKAHHVLFLDLFAAESAGSMTVLCVEKTSALTTNRMRVAHVLVAPPLISPSVDQYPALVDVSQPAVHADDVATFRQLAQCVIRTVRASSEDPIDGALLRFLRDRGADCDQIRQSDMGKIVEALPLDGTRKRDAVVVLEEGHPERIVVKGDVDGVLSRCTTIRGVDGAVSMLDHVQRAAIHRKMTSEREAGHEVVCFAYRDAHRGDLLRPSDGAPFASLDQELTLLGCVVMEEMMRPGAADALARLQRAGISICIVTGDDRARAMRVARECSILQDGADEADDSEGGRIAMDAAVFREHVVDHNGNLRQDEFDRLWPRLRVLARASPADKYLFVRGLQASQQRVGMLGGGHNDALALYACDVGIRLGQTTSKEWDQAAKIVLLDDNIGVIAIVVAWGRVVKTRLLQFVRLELTTVAVALILLLVGSITQQKAPLTTEQVLWIQMLLVLFIVSTRVGSSRDLRKHTHPTPASLGQELQDPVTTRWILYQAVYQLAILMLLLQYGSDMFDPKSTSPSNQSRKLEASRVSIHPSIPTKGTASTVLDSIGRGASRTSQVSVAATIVFNTFVWMHLFCQIACHSRPRLPLDNASRRFFFGWASLAIAQVAIVQLGGDWSNCEPLNVIQWTASVGFGVGALVVDFVSCNLFQSKSSYCT